MTSPATLAAWRARSGPSSPSTVGPTAHGVAARPAPWIARHDHGCQGPRRAPPPRNIRLLQPTEPSGLHQSLASPPPRRNIRLPQPTERSGIRHGVPAAARPPRNIQLLQPTEPSGLHHGAICPSPTHPRDTSPTPKGPAPMGSRAFRNEQSSSRAGTTGSHARGRSHPAAPTPRRRPRRCLRRSRCRRRWAACRPRPLPPRSAAPRCRGTARCRSRRGSACR